MKRKKMKASPFEGNVPVCEIRKNDEGKVIVFRGFKVIGEFDSVSVCPDIIVGKVGNKSIYFDNEGNHFLITQIKNDLVEIIWEKKE